MRKIIVTVTTLALAVLSSGLPAFAGGPQVESTIKAKLELRQNGPDVEIRVKVEGLTPDVVFTVRAYLPAASGMAPSSSASAVSPSAGSLSR